MEENVSGCFSEHSVHIFLFQLTYITNLNAYKHCTVHLVILSISYITVGEENFSLSENCLLMEKFSSKNTKFWAEIFILGMKI